MENPFEIILQKLNSIEVQLSEIKQQLNREHKDELMDITELGRYINYQKTSIYGLVQQRKIPFIKASGKLHFLKKDIDQWLGESKKMTVEEIKKKALEYDLSKSGSSSKFFQLPRLPRLQPLLLRSQKEPKYRKKTS